MKSVISLIYQKSCSPKMQICSSKLGKSSLSFSPKFSALGNSPVGNLKYKLITMSNLPWYYKSHLLSKLFYVYKHVSR